MLVGLLGERGEILQCLCLYTSGHLWFDSSPHCTQRPSLSLLDAVLWLIALRLFLCAVCVCSPGKPYCQAASDTWNLLQSSGITALVNDDITGAALFFAALISGLVGAAVAALLARGPLDEPMWGLWALFGGLIALGIVLIAMEVVGSAVVAFFVCYAEDPVALRTTKPHLFESMANAQSRHRGARPKVYAAAARPRQ